MRRLWRTSSVWSRNSADLKGHWLNSVWMSLLCLKTCLFLFSFKGHAHLTDFNIATIIRDGERATALAGTKPYMGKNPKLLLLKPWYLHENVSKIHHFYHLPPKQSRKLLKDGLIPVSCIAVIDLHCYVSEMIFVPTWQLLPALHQNKAHSFDFCYSWSCHHFLSCCWNSACKLLGARIIFFSPPYIICYLSSAGNFGHFVEKELASFINK